jgi:DNA-binding LacI/PurR family transcriptional regulator
LRQNAFITSVAELGIMLTTRINGGEYSYHARHGASLEIAAKGGTDAIFFANDIPAIGGIDALRKRVV